MTYLLDIGVIIIIILTIITDYKRGFAKSILGFVSNVASIFGAVYLGSYLSNLIYDNIIKDKIISDVTEKVSESTTGAVHTTVNTTGMPDFLDYIFSLFGFSTDKVSTDVSKAVESHGNSVAHGVESVVAPLVTAVLTFVLVILLFFIIRFILSRVCRLICKVMKLPVLSTVNKLFGGIFGILNGLIIVYFLAALIGILLPVLTGGKITFTDFNAVAERTELFRAFYVNNIILEIFDFIPAIFS
ncbi:MAG: CvpA family protein [Oscillospiraceae bacterium]|nr:CvpA family protein [Oscillospiraceae bacterium]